MTQRRALSRAALLALGTVAVLALSAPRAAQAACANTDTPITASNSYVVEAALFCLTNEYRVDEGKQALVRDSRLAAAARRHSYDMAERNYANHVTPEGVTATERAEAAGFTAGGIGENIAARTQTLTAQALLDQWKESSGHNNNMLLASHQTGGFGVVPGFPQAGVSGGVTAVQMFSNQPGNGSDEDLYAIQEAEAAAAAAAKAKAAACARARVVRNKARHALRRAIRRRKASRNRAQRVRRTRIVRRKRVAFNKAKRRAFNVCN